MKSKVQGGGAGPHLDVRERLPGGDDVGGGGHEDAAVHHVVAQELVVGACQKANSKHHVSHYSTLCIHIDMPLLEPRDACHERCCASGSMPAGGCPDRIYAKKRCAMGPYRVWEGFGMPVGGNAHPGPRPSRTGRRPGAWRSPGRCRCCRTPGCGSSSPASRAGRAAALRVARRQPQVRHSLLGKLRHLTGCIHRCKTQESAKGQARGGTNRSHSKGSVPGPRSVDLSWAAQG